MTDCERKDCCDNGEDPDIKQNEKLRRLFEELGLSDTEVQDEDNI